MELPDVFAVEVLSKVDLRDTLSLAQEKRTGTRCGASTVFGRCKRKSIV